MKQAGIGVDGRENLQLVCCIKREVHEIGRDYLEFREGGLALGEGGRHRSSRQLKQSREEEMGRIQKEGRRVTLGEVRSGSCPKEDIVAHALKK